MLQRSPHYRIHHSYQVVARGIPIATRDRIADAGSISRAADKLSTWLWPVDGSSLFKVRWLTGYATWKYHPWYATCINMHYMVDNTLRFISELWMLGNWAQNIFDIAFIETSSKFIQISSGDQHSPCQDFTNLMQPSPIWIDFFMDLTWITIIQVHVLHTSKTDYKEAV